MAHTEPSPATFTFGVFLNAFYDACTKMWDESGPGEPRHQPSVTLPDGLWPEVASLTSPLTGEQVPVQRVPMFAPVPCAPGVTVKTWTPCQPSAEGGLCGCNEDEETGPQDCLKMHCDH
jgi:hypothetical protein